MLVSLREAGLLDESRMFLSEAARRVDQEREKLSQAVKQEIDECQEMETDIRKRIGDYPEAISSFQQAYRDLKDLYEKRRGKSGRPVNSRAYRAFIRAAKDFHKICPQYDQFLDPLRDIRDITGVDPEVVGPWRG